MLRVKYILLVKHFEGQASKDEEQEIELWRNENIINNLTYLRLKRVWGESSKRELLVSKSQKEEKMWKNIIDKIISEEEPVQESGTIWSGSGRSGGMVKLHELLSECESLVVRAGGHAAAAGRRAGVDAIHGNHRIP